MTEQFRRQQTSPVVYASPQALAAADLTTLPDLTPLSVGVVNDQYLYFAAPSPSPTPDGLTVISPAAPAGALAIRQYIRNTLAQYSTAWWIDPVSGDDRNSGTSALAPLKTLVEWGNRIRNADITQNVTVTLLSGTITDIGPLDIHIGTGILVTFQGDVSSSSASTFSSVVTTDPSTNTRGTVTDAGGAFARTQRLRLTSGANSGAITWCQGGTTSTTAVVSGWTNFASGHAPVGNVNPTAAPASGGDSYVRDTLNTIFQGRMDIRIHGAGRIIWKDVRFTSDPASSFNAFQYWRPQNDQSSVAGVQFVACLFDSNCFAGFTSATFYLTQCLFQSSCNVSSNSTAGMNACVFQSTLFVGFDSAVQVGGPITLDGGRILQTNAGFIEWNTAQIEAGATSSSGVCWEIDPTCGTYGHSNSRLWGPTSGYQIGVRTYSNASFQYINVPTLTGNTITDARIAGNDKTWAQLPFVDTGHLSQAVSLP